ncbi:Ig-like domain-containing protein [Mucilaginibacter sp. JRF]|uniref:Ig-like domain-containing protein n=1 Tax=Mucilaginibacter sp. JRF TaxID=2780088 RepID=UPI00187EA708|nr:Ig-like domain-containing protein [Mucilaginibacter sp. JRF]MBE9585861.1 Ig-like domain-containing protein [Mucilaginibacter sp. JRF]
MNKLLIGMLMLLGYQQGFSKPVLNAATQAIPDTCSPVSTLPCSALKPTLPYQLNFDAAVPNTILDKNQVGTGFTTVNTYSGTRISTDPKIYDAKVPGYVPSKITVTGGRLQIVAGKGIDYLSNNNMLNTLGIQVSAAKRLMLEVKLINPFYGEQSQQAGLWYGLNDKTFIKLGVTGNKVELRREINDVTSTNTTSTNQDRRITGVISGLNTKTVSLRLVIDSAMQTVDGYYSTDGVNYINAGSVGYPLASVSLQGTGLTSGTLYAGIFSTYRSGASAVTYTYDDFTVSSLTTTGFTGCSPLSTIPCQNLDVQLPFSLSFDASVNNSIQDKNGLGTGFTTVNPYSKARFNIDGKPKLTQVPGYEQDNINLVNGHLQLTTNKGNDYTTNNSQLNVLGARINAYGKTQVDLRMINPYNGNAEQQGGIWYGFNDKTFIKLSIKANKVELRKEVNDVTNNGSDYVRVTAVIPNLNTKTVDLRLIVDDASQTAEGFYSIDGGNIYTSTGATGYTSTTLSIAGTGLGNGTLFAGLYGTYRNGTVPFVYTFDDFKISRPQPPIPTLALTKDTLHFTVIKGGQILPDSVGISANTALNSYTIEKTEAPWLTLPTNLTNNLVFGVGNISSSLAVGDHQALVTFRSEGFTPKSLLIDLSVIEPLTPKVMNVNFQDEQTTPPLDYMIDYGQAYGERIGRQQQSGFTYGWRKKSDGTPLSLVGNGRVRTLPEDILLATVMHMQANHITSSFTGVKTEGYWEMAVPNGNYNVTVSVGDGSVGAAVEKHTINIEGINAINSFIPQGKAGDNGRFSTRTINVNVADERLTIDATGGTNTKITYASIAPVSTAPYLYTDLKSQNIVLRKGADSVSSFKLVIGNSANANLNYDIQTIYEGANTGWLSVTNSQSGKQLTKVFNYAAANNLPYGTYYATLKITAANYTSTILKVQLNVVDGQRPYVKGSNPPNGATNVSLTTSSVSANYLHVPVVEGYKGGVDNETIDSTTVRFYKVVNNVLTRVSGTVQGTGGGDAVSFSPKTLLEPYTKYKFEITSGVKSYSGAAFTPYELYFTTGAADVDSSQFLYAQFQKIPIPGTQNIKYSTLTFGPDDKFYALRMDGIIERFDVDHTTGNLSNKKQIKTLTNKYGMRTAIGLAFDPRSTPTQPIAWVTHSSYGLDNAPTYDGNISRLTGDSLSNEELIINKLPRSTRDHLTNSIAFGPDSALYISQGSNSSAGLYDDDWQRNETLLSGAVLKLDLNKLTGITLPLNVQTSSSQAVINAAPANSITMSDGKYNPYATNSPLTIFASGVRNAYDLLWHSNGQLYVPTNGSGGGGKSPGSVIGTRLPDGTFYNGPEIPATPTGKSVQVQVDWLFRVNPKLGVGYYGHPNPLRGEYVINRGYLDNALYSPAITADANFRIGYNFGLNHSPNGVIEYKSNNFNGALKGKILVCRFSGGSDITVLEPGSMVKLPDTVLRDTAYNIIKVNTGSSNTGLTGMSGFANPLDVVEDVTNGNLYVSEFNWNDNTNLMAQITLLKAQAQPSPARARLAVALNKEESADPEVQNGDYWLTIMNQGDTTLTIKDIDLSGAGASNFKLVDMIKPSAQKPLLLASQSAVSYKVSSLDLNNKPAEAVMAVTTVDDTVKRVILKNVFADTLAQANRKLIKPADALNKPVVKRALIVYPNPVTGSTVNVALKGFAVNETYDVSVYNKDGKKLLTKKVQVSTEGTTQTTFSVGNDWSLGLYIIRAVGRGTTEAAKFILDR